MSTFFEKLTGSRSKTDAPDTAELVSATRETIRRATRTPNISYDEPKTTHLRVEAGDTPSSAGEEADTEEGELTVDIYDKGDAIVIQSTVAGVRPEDLDVSITTDTVTIRGARERQEEVEEKNYYYKELFWGTFSRSVILPEEIDENLAEATLKHGLLSIRLPKKKKGTVQKLKVKVT